MKRMFLAMVLAFCASLGTRAYEKSPHEQWQELKTISTICSEEGKRIVETFAEEFLPNAYGRYEKARDAAKELNQVFNEEFPEPVSRDDDTYAVCEKLKGRLRTAVEVYRSEKDELAHLYFRHKAGAITSKELSRLDEQPLKIKIWKFPSQQEPPTVKTLGDKQAAFAAKFMPETFAQYQLFAKEHAQAVRLYKELSEALVSTSSPFEQVTLSVKRKAVRLGKAANALVSAYNKLYMEHRIGDVDTEGVSKADQKMATALNGLVKSVPTMVRTGVANPGKVICDQEIYDNMVAIPGRSFKMGRTEVTQCMWQLVMGSNPSYFKGPDRPVENVSLYDCQEFIMKLNAISGHRFRLPTGEEWEFCCRAGSKGDYGKRANGQEGPLYVMGWYDGDGSSTHPVAQKEPNAWGLYDMHGNVQEWTSSSRGDDIDRRGGGWNGDEWDCMAWQHGGSNPRSKFDYLGFRLVSED